MPSARIVTRVLSQDTLNEIAAQEPVRRSLEMSPGGFSPAFLESLEEATRKRQYVRVAILALMAGNFTPTEHADPGVSDDLVDMVMAGPTLEDMCAFIAAGGADGGAIPVNEEAVLIRVERAAASRQDWLNLHPSARVHPAEAGLDRQARATRAAVSAAWVQAASSLTTQRDDELQRLADTELDVGAESGDDAEPDVAAESGDDAEPDVDAESGDGGERSQSGDAGRQQGGGWRKQRGGSGQSQGGGSGQSQGGGSGQSQGGGGRKRGRGRGRRGLRLN